MMMMCLSTAAAVRAKMVAMKGVSKLRGQHGTLLYPQPEGQLGECMSKYGRELGDESLLGKYSCNSSSSRVVVVVVQRTPQ